MEGYKQAVNDDDVESAHLYYDELVYLIAKKADPAAVAEIDSLFDKNRFWYA